MFEKSSRIKVSMFFIIIFMAISFFIVNWYLLFQFRKQLNKQVQTIVNVYYDTLSDENDAFNINETIIPLISHLGVPIVITTKEKDGGVAYQEINLSADLLELDGDEKEIHLSKLVYSMDRINNPLPLYSEDGIPKIEIHYGDSLIMNSIRWLPFLQFSFAIVVMISVFFGLRLLLASEKNYIYAGLSKETAHQLGTPISSLLGWLQLLEEKKKIPTEEILVSMKSDVKKLENITDKFNKIGSSPVLFNLDIYDILLECTTYFNSKLPKKSKTKIELIAKSGLIVKGDKTLLYWSFENIIKNALQSLSQIDDGLLSIEAKIDKNNWIIIDFTDNGYGILRKNKSKIFNPGFSTKKRGWGIGLNLSKRIINHHHYGNLSLIKASHKKTTFRISLKLSTS